MMILSPDGTVLINWLDAGEHVEIPAGVTTIGDLAFVNCQAITSVSGPDVVVIGKKAFYDCVNLKSVNFPSVTEIRVQAFYDCEKLKNLNLLAVQVIGAEAFVGCYELAVLKCPELRAIYPAAFLGCESLGPANFDCPQLRFVAHRAFHECTWLTSVTLSNIEYLDEYAFYGSEVREIYLSNTIKEIYDYSHSFYDLISEQPRDFGDFASDEPNYIDCFTAASSHWDICGLRMDDPNVTFPDIFIDSSLGAVYALAEANRVERLLPEWLKRKVKIAPPQLVFGGAGGLAPCSVAATNFPKPMFYKASLSDETLAVPDVATWPESVWSGGKVGAFKKYESNRLK